MTTPRSLPLLLITLLLAGTLSACGDPEASQRAASHEAHPIDAQQCSACGMTVREQPAPRAQVIHRDETRLYFCAIGDLLAHLASPSPHGAVDAIFVETLSADANAEDADTGAHPWKPAAEAAYVVGVTRRVMGEPVLVYSSLSEAEASAARQPGARALDWSGLLGWMEEEKGIRVPR